MSNGGLYDQDCLHEFLLTYVSRAIIAVEVDHIFVNISKQQPLSWDECRMMSKNACLCSIFCNGRGCLGTEIAKLSWS